LHPGIYQARLIFDFSFRPTVVIRFKAVDERDARGKLPALLEDGQFREQLVQQLVRDIFSSPHVEAVTTGVLRIEDDAPADEPSWEIVTDPS
jgi:hypothetical protein